MDTIDTAIIKSQSFQHIWRLLNPSAVYSDRENACRNLWNALSLARQRQIYWAIREQKKRGEQVNPNPYFAIKDCVPLPTNWNGRPGINDMMKSGEKMVSARFKPTAKYGIYTLFEAQLFEMEDITPLNYNLDKS